MEPNEKPSIVTVLTHYGFDFPAHIRPGGTKVKCAFHGDRIESAIVNEYHQSVVCFTCGRKGDSIKIIQDEESLSFKEALAFAAEQGWYDNTDMVLSKPQRKGRKKRSVRSVRRQRRRR